MLVSFEREMALYRRLLPGLLKASTGKFVVIKDDQLLGIFNTHDEGYAAALDAYGVVSFLLQPVREKEPIASIPALELGILHAKV